MCTVRGSNQGPLGPKSDALTTAPLRHLKSYETGNMIMECSENAYRHLSIIHSLRPISKRTNNSIKFVSLPSKFLKEETMIMRRTNLGKT